MIFDPRCRRASNKGATAQAEHVTGTHLFEYLQDAAMVGSGGPASGIESSDKAAEIYEVQNIQEHGCVEKIDFNFPFFLPSCRRRLLLPITCSQ